MFKKEIPTEKVRKAFEKSGLSKSELASRLGWTQPHIQRLNRALGYVPDSNSKGGVRTVPRETINYELALKIVDAMNADYTDVGV